MNSRAETILDGWLHVLQSFGKIPCRCLELWDSLLSSNRCLPNKIHISLSLQHLIWPRCLDRQMTSSDPVKCQLVILNPRPNSLHPGPTREVIPSRPQPGQTSAIYTLFTKPPPRPRPRPGHPTPILVPTCPHPRSHPSRTARVKDGESGIPPDPRPQSLSRTRPWLQMGPGQNRGIFENSHQMPILGAHHPIKLL